MEIDKIVRDKVALFEKVLKETVDKDISVWQQVIIYHELCVDLRKGDRKGQLEEEG